MAKAKPFTDDEKNTLVELHGQGLSLNQIAKQMNRPESTIHLHSKKLGLAYDRTQTEAATAARQADLKAKRLQLEADLLEDAMNLRAKMYEPLEVHNFDVKNGQLVSDEISEPTPKDLVDLIKAATYALNASNKLAEITSGNGEDEAKSMLGQFLAATKAIADLEASHDEADPESEAD